jgi:putative hemolysin
MKELSNDTKKPDKSSQVLIDVDEIFRRKSGKLYPFIPRFLIQYLKRIVHQDQINEALTRYKDRFGLDFLEAILNEYFTVDIEVRNQENIPSHGKYIVASNHPLGGLDGMALMHVIGKKRRDIKFLSNDLLLEIKNLQSMFVAVNKLGRNNTEIVKLINELYESDNMVLIFPAGLVSRKQKGGVIKDLEWKKSFITKAVKHKRDIVPVYIEGHNSRFFYNLARFRKIIGLKANLEMLYLPDEMFKQADKKMIITFGKPIPYTFFTKAQTHYEWAQWVKEHVYAMTREPSI